MKKLFSILLSATLLLGVVGCGSSNDATTDATSEDGNVIIVGLDDTFSPMGFRDENNELIGFDIDLAKAAGEKMGAEIQFQPIDWDTKEIEIKSGKIDLIWNGFTVTEERKETFEFTKPYLDNKQLIIVRDDSTIASKAELEGKKVGLQEASSALEAVSKDEISQAFAEMPTYDTNVLAFQDLSIGRIDAVVADEITAKYYIENNPDCQLKTIDDDFGSEQYAVAANKGNTELIEKLQAALDEMNEDGTSAEISKKWFGEDIVVK